MLLVVPVYETRMTGIHHYTAVVINADGRYLGKYRKAHIPHVEIVFNRSVTVAGLSEYLWKLEQPARAVANGYFVGAVNRVGYEAPWNIGEFYGRRYFCDPSGKIIAWASRGRDELAFATLNLDEIPERIDL